jgi:hypothetical protein
MVGNRIPNNLKKSEHNAGGQPAFSLWRRNTHDQKAIGHLHSSGDHDGGIADSIFGARGFRLYQHPELH